MKRFLLALLFLILCHPLAAWADENVRAVQTQLRQEGFYFGDPDGIYNEETAAAVTRYQIRHGLQITGKLDTPTAKALGTSVQPASSGAATPALSGTWRQLRSGAQQFVPSEAGPDVPSRPHPTAPPAAVGRGAVAQSPFSRERLRDYVGAFVLAGLDPKVGAELEFFADRVEYFGVGLSREKVRRDLLRYDARWPERRFWLAGDLEIRHESNQRMRITFPLRYELRSRSKRASGTVRKTLVLRKAGNGDLEIVAVNEEKIR